MKVWFPWDRYNAKDENSSCWIRVSQAWAGSGFGGMMIPRIVQEVIVAYLDGDVDQPIVIGRSFHAVNKVPNGLAEAKTQMSLRSQTHKGEGYNELTFEDEAGKEEMLMHAQKDQNTVVGNDQSTKVAANQSATIGGNRTKAVTGNQSESVGPNKDITVTGDHKEQIGGLQTIDITGSQTETIGKRQTLIITTVGQKITVSAGPREVNVNSGNETINVPAGRSTETISLTKAINAKDIKTNSETFTSEASNTILMKGDSSVTHESGGSKVELTPDSITLSLGASSITMDTSHITIKSPNISLEGSNVSVTGGTHVGVNGAGATADFNGNVKIVGGRIDLNN